MNTHSPGKPAAHWLERWHVDPSANRNYDFVDGLRGVAILMVVVCHSFYARETAGSASWLLLHVSVQFGKGVNLFFTISGFLISWPFWKRKAGGVEGLIPRGYGWRRFWKIYPPLALSVLVLTPIYILWGGDPAGFLRTALQWLTGLAFLMPVSNRLNPPMWSLVVEVHFYLILPLLFLLTKRLPARTCLWLIGGIFLFAIPVSIQALTGRAPTYAPEICDPYATGLSCFCLGVAAAGIDALKLWHKGWARLGDAGWFIMALGLAGSAWAGMRTAPAITPYLFQWTFVLGTACVLGYAAAPEHPRAQWLCAPWLRWCGIISYEWYLFHQPILYWSRLLFGPAHGNVFKYSLVLGVPLVVSVVFSALVYRCFSLPILQYGRARKSAGK